MSILIHGSLHCGVTLGLFSKRNNAVYVHIVLFMQTLCFLCDRLCILGVFVYVLRPSPSGSSVGSPTPPPLAPLQATPSPRAPLLVEATHSLAARCVIGECDKEYNTHVHP